MDQPEPTMPDRRREILQAAEKVFDARGYAATTVDAVASEAGTSKGNIYNYFRSKEELFRQVLADAIRTAETDLADVLTDERPARRRLELILDFWFRTTSYYQRVGRLVLEFWAAAARGEAGGDLIEHLRQAYHEWRERIASILAQGVRSGEFRPGLDARTSAALIMGILDGIEVQSILGTGVQVDEEFFAALKRAVLAGLTAGADLQARDAEGGAP